MPQIEPNLLVLVTERTSYAPGDQIWVNITLQRPSSPPPYSGLLTLSGDERSTLLNGQTQSIAIFDPVQVELESNETGTWRVSLELPRDVPPSCDLGAIPPSGLVLYVLTARMNKAATTLDQSTCTRKVKVVSTQQMALAPPADQAGQLLAPPRMFGSLSCFASCSGGQGKPRRREDANQRLGGEEDMAYVRQCCELTRRTTTSSSSSSLLPEFRVSIPDRTSIRCGEHLPYRVEIRGSGPAASSSDKYYARIKAIRVWIRRTRTFSDGNGLDNTLQDVAKQPQWIDFAGGQGGVLPVSFESHLGIPLGMAPTVRGSLVTNEYDLVIEVLTVRNVVCGALDVPITVWRDVEGNLSQPAFSPTLRSAKAAADYLLGMMPPLMTDPVEGDTASHDGGGHSSHNTANGYVTEEEEDDEAHGGNTYLGTPTATASAPVGNISSASSFTDPASRIVALT